MKKLIYISLGICLFILTPSTLAAVEVRYQGSVYTEIATQPGQELRAGNRVRLYSELGNTNYPQLKVLMVMLNQRAGELSPFYIYSSNNYKFNNTLSWVELKLKGELYPRGPKVNLDIGNVEVNYSPYTVSIKNDIMNPYCSNYGNHRGVVLRDLGLLGFNSSSFILWGFGPADANMIGVKATRDFIDTQFTGIIADFRQRLGGNQEGNIVANLEYQQLRSVEVEKELGYLGRYGTISALVIAQEQKKFSDSMPEISVLNQYEWEFPLALNQTLKIGFRDFPANFNPLLRDKTPEYDERTGYYLGGNPVDIYRDRRGYYFQLDVSNEGLELSSSLSQMENHDTIPTKFILSDLSLSFELGPWLVDGYLCYEQQEHILPTMVRSPIGESFTRICLNRILTKTDNYLVTSGVNIRLKDTIRSNEKEFGFFYRYQYQDTFITECGLRHVLEGDNKYWMGVKYLSPTGLNISYRRSSAPMASDGKAHYDPDKRLLEPDDLFQVSLEVEF